jgi:trehalose/maltose hydrolase-like predicted phosphorylase
MPTEQFSEFLDNKKAQQTKKEQLYAEADSPFDESLSQTDTPHEKHLDMIASNINGEDQEIELKTEDLEDVQDINSSEDNKRIKWADKKNSNDQLPPIKKPDELETGNPLN